MNALKIGLNFAQYRLMVYIFKLEYSCLHAYGVKRLDYI